jgi:hypothetical protein
MTTIRNLNVNESKMVKKLCAKILIKDCLANIIFTRQRFRHFYSSKENTRNVIIEHVTDFQKYLLKERRKDIDVVKIHFWGILFLDDLYSWVSFLQQNNLKIIHFSRELFFKLRVSDMFIQKHRRKYRFRI